jgi:hypothetical protein
VLGAVVLAQEHERVAGLEPHGVELAGAEVVVLVEVDRERVDRRQPGRERDDADGGGEADRDESTER